MFLFYLSQDVNQVFEATLTINVIVESIIIHENQVISNKCEFYVVKDVDFNHGVVHELGLNLAVMNLVFQC